MQYPNPCTLCALHLGSPTVCMGPGKPTKKRDILIICDYPTAQQATSKLVDAGPVGKALFEILAQCGLADRVQFTWGVKCAPAYDQAPSTAQIRTCLPYLLNDIAQHRPSVIVAMGQLPIKVLSDPELKTRAGIRVSEWRNRRTFTHSYTHQDEARTVPIIATYSPQQCQRTPNLWKDFVDDLHRVLDVEVEAVQPVKWAYFPKVTRSLLGAIWGSVGLDLETTGVNPFARDARILSASWSPKDHTAKVTTDVDGLVANLSAGVVFGSNIKFDLLWLLRHVTTLAPSKRKRYLTWLKHVYLYDTQVLAHLADENQPSKGLKYLASIHTTYGAYDEGVKAARTNSQMGMVNPEDLYQYNAYDASASRVVAQALAKTLTPGELNLAFVLSDVIKALVHLEHHGIRVDRERCSALAEEASERIRMIERGFKGINLASPKQLGDYLYNKLGFPIQKETKSGNPSTDEATLEDLHVWAMGQPRAGNKLTAIALIREHRKLGKQVSTYYLPIQEKLDADGYLHPSYNITGTVTGRLSCSDPNLMNIPRSKTADVKQVFIADPGCVLIQADYSQIELRLGAMLAQEDTMLRAFADGEDLHTKTARLILKREPTSEERTHAKSVNFGIFYGIGPHKLALDTGMPIQEAKRFISEWFLAYPKVKQWLKLQESTVLDLGYVTSIFGRKRRLPLYVASRADQMRVVRQACNFPVQSSAGELTLFAMARVQQQLPEGATVVATVHDSLLINCRKEDAKSVSALVRRIMEDATALVQSYGWEFKITVPTPVDISTGKRWGDLK